jgi:predicted RNA binding protein with dsRBD fold (UPF0201 family)
MNDRTELINEAAELGLSHQKNVKTFKLAEMLAEHKGEPLPVKEVVPAGPAIKLEKEESEDIESAEQTVQGKQSLAQIRAGIRRKKVADARKKAFKTTVVTITNKDNRENDYMTAAYLSFENQHFGLSKQVPLDVPVEVENSLIAIAERATMTLHKAEIINGKHTGNKTAVTVKKFAVSYGKPA